MPVEVQPPTRNDAALLVVGRGETCDGGATVVHQGGGGPLSETCRASAAWHRRHSVPKRPSLASVVTAAQALTGTEACVPWHSLRLPRYLGKQAPQAGKVP